MTPCRRRATPRCTGPVRWVMRSAKRSLAGSRNNVSSTTPVVIPHLNIVMNLFSRYRKASRLTPKKWPLDLRFIMIRVYPETVRSLVPTAMPWMRAAWMAEKRQLVWVVQSVLLMRRRYLTRSLTLNNSGMVVRRHCRLRRAVHRWTRLKWHRNPGMKLSRNWIKIRCWNKSLPRSTPRDSAAIILPMPLLSLRKR